MSTRSPAAIAAGLVLGVVAVSSSAILIRLAEDAQPLAIAFWRTTLGTLVLAPFAWRAQRGQTPLGARTRGLLVGSGLFLAAHFAMFIGSLRLTTVASSVTLTTINPLFVALGGWWLLHEQPTRRTWWGMGVTMVGAVVIGLADASAIDLGGRALLGDAMAFGAAVAVTGYLLIGRFLRQALPNAVYASAVYGVAGVALAVAALGSGAELTGYGTTTWLAIGGLTIGPQLLGHTVFNALLSDVSPTTVSIVVLAEPVVATLLAWSILDELPAELFWVGAPIVVVGVFVATARAGRRGRSAELALEA